jgi:acyl-CoA reductase-like NAD-dependent aldehyde dehydrogenase
MNATLTTDLTAAARAAQPAWAALPLDKRLAHVRALRHLLASSADRVLAVLAEEVGKSAGEALGGEIVPTADAFAWVEKHAARILHPRYVTSGDRPIWLMGQDDAVYRRPRGVVGIIGTWNYPLFLNGVQIVQALVAGNAVVWKPSEVVPRFASVWADLIAQAGFPQGVFTVLPATREMGQVLAEADIDHVVFTGSAGVGRKLAARLGERLISSTLELSGCDAMFVLDDADLKFAARAAWFGVSLNRGQTCIAVRRVFVPAQLAETFCGHLRELAICAPVRLAMPAQVRQARQLADDAIAAGASPIVPIQGDEESIAPVLLRGIRPEMALCREAAFSPILGVVPYESLEQALADEARCPFALAASVFTADPGRGEALAPRLRAGAVCINDVVAPTAHPATPFGGRGDSGWGVTQGAEGLLEMTVPQVVSVRGGTFRPHYDKDDETKSAPQEELLRGLLQAGHSPTIWGRIAGFWRVVRAALSGGA